MYSASYFRLFKYMVSFSRYFTVCITYQPPLVIALVGCMEETCLPCSLHTYSLFQINNLLKSQAIIIMLSPVIMQFNACVRTEILFPVSFWSSCYSLLFCIYMFVQFFLYAIYQLSTITSPFGFARSISLCQLKLLVSCQHN